MTSLLRATGLDKHYDGVHALSAVDLSVETGEVHALVGENGAGKSTLGKILAGVVQADRGEIELDGRAVHFGGPLDAQKAGIGMIFQELDLFQHLTAAENVALCNPRLETTWVRPRRLDALCRPYLEQAELAAPPRTPLHRLAVGDQQRVAIARALAMDARLLVMDEPTSSLTEDAVESLLQRVERLRDAGVAIIYVSHKMEEILRIADRVTVLRDGRVVGMREAQSTDADELVRMMVGRDPETLPETGPPATARPLLEVRGLSTHKLKDVSFALREGEVLGLAGLVGAGRSELGAALFGLDAILSGEVLLRGRPLRGRGPRDAIAQGIGLLPEDRKLQGLMMQMSTLENSSLGILSRLTKFGFVRVGEERRLGADAHRNVAVKSASPHSPVSSLSGGNQQKVLLSRWLLVDPDVLFLDDPTRGVDVGAKLDIHRILRQFAARPGKAVVMVSSELPELLSCSDRILVLRDGRVKGLFDSRATSQEEILALATGGRE